MTIKDEVIIKMTQGEAYDLALALQHKAADIRKGKSRNYVDGEIARLSDFWEGFAINIMKQVNTQEKK
jgi:hypothetical protein